MERGLCPLESLVLINALGSCYHLAESPMLKLASYCVLGDCLVKS